MQYLRFHDAADLWPGFLSAPCQKEMTRAQFHVCGDAKVRVVGGRCAVDVRVNVRSMCGSMCGRCAGQCAVNVRVDVRSMCGSMCGQCAAAFCLHSCCILAAFRMRPFPIRVTRGCHRCNARLKQWIRSVCIACAPWNCSDCVAAAFWLLLLAASGFGSGGVCSAL